LRADNNGTVRIELKEKASNLAADQVLLIHQEGGQLVISLRSRAMHLAGAPALTARALVRLATWIIREIEHASLYSKKLHVANPVCPDDVFTEKTVCG